LDWFGADPEANVIASAVPFPLVGVVLLSDHVLSVDYPGRVVTLM
jgi:hypothetical protein